MKRQWFVYAALAMLGGPAAMAQEVRVFVTSRAGERLAEKAPLRLDNKGAQGALFKIEPGKRLQKMDGFGASFLEAGMICLNSLTAADQERLLEAIFDPAKGAGFSAMKTVQAGTDFMSAGPWYTYDDTPGDVEMKHFSIARDLAPNGLIPLIKRARKYGSFQLQAPMDYPPDWMLFDVNKNQDVNPKYFEAMARYQVRYLQEYARQGIEIEYLDPFNEPGIYTKIPAGKIAIYVRDHLGPLLAKSGLKTRIQYSDFNERTKFLEAVNQTMGDEGFRKYVSSLAYHAYGFKDFDKVRQIHQRFPNLPVWMTEVCHAYYTDTKRGQPLPRYDYEDGHFWGTQIFNDLESGTSAWIYWNLILDETGGPWLVSKVHGNPEDNGQQPLVVVDRKQKKVTYLPGFYYLAHFSKFVRPGAFRLEASGAASGIRVLAFENADGSIVAEVLNSRTEPVTTTLQSGGRSVQVSLAPMSITTCTWRQPK
jgi:glucosylceramidase